MDINDPKYKQESYRLHTFADWSIDHFVDRAELARDGFIYSGQGDRVGCVFCSRNVENWQRGDDPRAEHESNRSCLFILGYEVGNVPIDRPDPRRNTLMDGHQPTLSVS